MTDDLQKYNEFNIESLKEKITVLEKKCVSLREDLLKMNINLNKLENSSRKVEEVEQNLIRFSETLKKLNDLENQIHALNSEIQSIKISRSADSVVTSLIKFIGGAVIVGLIGIILTLIFGVPVPPIKP